MEIVGLLRKSQQLVNIITKLEAARQIGNDRKVRALKHELDFILGPIKFAHSHFDRAIVEVQGLRANLQGCQEELTRQVQYLKGVDALHTLHTWIKTEFIPMMRVWESERTKIYMPDIFDELENRIGLED